VPEDEVGCREADGRDDAQAEDEADEEGLLGRAHDATADWVITLSGLVRIQIGFRRLGWVKCCSVDEVG